MRGGLPMYDLPELRAATDLWWAGLASHVAAAGGGELPRLPERPESVEDLWLAPDLGLAQTCGYPLTHALAGRVRYVATPCYGAPGCRGASYSSAILVRDQGLARDLPSLRGCRAAINDWNSQSGMSALRHAVAPLARNEAFFAAVVETGSHRASLAALRQRQADVAAVDCVTLELLRQVAPRELEGLRRLDWTLPAPGLPLITRAGATEEQLAALRAGLAAAFQDPALSQARSALLLMGFEVLPEEAYGVLVQAEKAAAKAGYPVLR